MKTIPRPTTPSTIQTIQWLLDPVAYLETNFQRYGDIFYGRVLPQHPDPVVLVNHPQGAQYLLSRDQDKEFSAPTESPLTTLLGENAITLVTGKKHRRLRQLLMPPFHGERIKVFGEHICEIAREAIASWPSDCPQDTKTAMEQITLRTVLQVVFGLHSGERYRQLEGLLLSLVSSPLTALSLVFAPLRADLGPWSPGGKLRRTLEATDRLIFAEIQARRENPDPERADILSMLLEAKDEEGRGLTNLDLRDNLVNLLVAGYASTSTALTWALYWVHSLPHVRTKLLAELASLGSSPDPIALSQLPYLGAVCNESLRIYPGGILTFSRQVESPVELMGYALKPKTLVAACIYLIHHREDIYPDPDTFNPERFLERQFSAYEFMPFGNGARRCIGAALARYEIKLVLGTILSNWTLELANNKPVKATRRSLTLEPNLPVKLKKVSR